MDLIAVHVDDMALITFDDKSMEHLKEELRSKFTISDLGPLKQMVGLEFTRDVLRSTTICSLRFYLSVYSCMLFIYSRSL
jgi:hypothetical protein